MTFKKRVLAAVTLLSLLAFAGANSATFARTVSTATSNNIEGTWLTQITATSCQTGLPLGSFSSIYSFADGGTLTNITNGASPATRTPGLGAWEKTGDHAFKAVSTALLFNAAGVWTGTQKIASTLEILQDRNELTGLISVEVSNTSGITVSTMCATLVGQRLEP